MSDVQSTVSKKVSEFTSGNVGAVKLAQLEKVNAVALDLPVTAIDNT